MGKNREDFYMKQLQCHNSIVFDLLCMFTKLIHLCHSLSSLTAGFLVTGLICLFVWRTHNIIIISIITVAGAAAVLLSATGGSCLEGLLLEEAACPDWGRGLCCCCCFSLSLGCPASVLGSALSTILVCVVSGGSVLQEEASVSETFLSFKCRPKCLLSSLLLIQCSHVCGTALTLGHISVFWQEEKAALTLRWISDVHPEKSSEKSDAAELHSESSRF